MLGGERVRDVSSLPSVDATEQANRCRVLIYAVVKQALIDHRKSLKSARRELSGIRKDQRLPMPTDSEVLAYAVNKEPGRWLMSDNTSRMSFRWCCDHIGVDPMWVRTRMNRAELGFALDHYENKEA